MRLFGKDINFGKKAFTTITLDQAIRYLSQYLTTGDLNLSKIYQSQIWVFACIKQIASNISQVPFKIYSKSNDEEVTSGDVVRFFSYVNPYSSKFDLWFGTELFKNTRGEGYWHIIPDARGVPMEMEFLEPLRMTPVVFEGELSGWRYQKKGGGYVTIDSEFIIQFKFFNDNEPLRGLSPLLATQKSIESDTLSRDLNNNMLAQGTYPGSVLETDKKLTDEQFKRLKSQFRQEHEGVSKAGKFALLEGGLKFKEVKLTNTDLQYIDQKKLTKEEIHSAFGVPIAITGTTDSFNRANMDTIKREFWTKTLIPEMRYIEDVLRTNFFDVYFKEYYGAFNVAAIPELQADFKLLAEIAQIYANMNIPFEEINRRFSLGFEVDDYPWLKTPLVPFNLVPIDQISGSTEPAQQNTTEELSFEKLSKKFVNTLDEIKKKEIDKKYFIWKSFIDLWRPLKNKYQSKLREFIFELRQEVLNNYFDTASLGMDSPLKDCKIEADSPLFDFDDANKRLIALSSPFFEDAIIQGGNLALREIGIETAYELVDQAAINFFNSKLVNIKRILDTTKNNLVDTLKQSIETGLTVNETADKIRNVFNVTANRARSIARTEIGGAINGSKNETFKENGVEKKEWIQSFDDKVRETHQLSGEAAIANIDEPFENGLMYPHDPGASAEEVVNCRCTITAVITLPEEE